MVHLLNYLLNIETYCGGSSHDCPCTSSNFVDDVGLTRIFRNVSNNMLYLLRVSYPYVMSVGLCTDQ